MNSFYKIQFKIKFVKKVRNAVDGQWIEHFSDKELYLIHIFF